MAEERPSGEKPTREGLIYDFYFDEASRLGQRTDWFLIFHAILLEAFFSIHDGQRIPKLIVGAVGCLTSYLWFMTGCRQRWLSRHLGACVGEGLAGEDLGKLFKDIFENRRNMSVWIRWARPLPTFAVVIPFAFLTAWLSLTAYVEPEKWVCVIVGAIAAFSVATCAIAMMGSGPDGLEKFVPSKPDKKAADEKTNH